MNRSLDGNRIPGLVEWEDDLSSLGEGGRSCVSEPCPSQKNPSAKPIGYEKISGETALPGEILYSASAGMSYAYLAGVIDTKGQFTDAKGRGRLILRDISKETCKILTMELGAGSWRRTGEDRYYWYCPVKEVYDALSIVLPFLRVRFDEASKAMSLCLAENRIEIVQQLMEKLHAR